MGENLAPDSQGDIGHDKGVPPESKGKIPLSVFLLLSASLIVFLYMLMSWFEMQRGTEGGPPDVIERCQREYIESMLPLLEEFMWYEEIASRTPRLELYLQVNRLKDIQQEAKALRSTSCDYLLHEAFLEYLDAAIHQQLATMVYNDLEIADWTLKADKALRKLDRLVSLSYDDGLYGAFRENGYNVILLGQRRLK